MQGGPKTWSQAVRRTIRIQRIMIVLAGMLLATAHADRAQSTEWNLLGEADRARAQEPVLPSTSRLPAATHVDYDAYLANRGPLSETPAQFVSPYDISPYDRGVAEPSYDQVGGPSWQLLPEGMVYDSYLAGTKEARFAFHLMDLNSQGLHFIGFLGARVPLLRYGTTNSLRPEGFQIDVEGLAHVRIDLADDWVVDAADFRGGIPLSYGYGKHRTKLGYYHLSSHLQDEFMAANPGFVRVNYARDVLVLGHSYYMTDQLRIYGEVGYAFVSDVSEPWEFQFGLDYAPYLPTGIRGAPFAAFNGHLRE